METLDRVVSIPASERVGWVVLERELRDHGVRAGDRIRVTFQGWRRSNTTGNAYQLATVDVLRSLYELRSKRPSGMSQDFVPLAEIDRAAAAILNRSQMTDVYVGAAPRADRQGAWTRLSACGA